MMKRRSQPQGREDPAATTPAARAAPPSTRTFTVIYDDLRNFDPAEIAEVSVWIGSRNSTA
jgi:hypothetical protein